MTNFDFSGYATRNDLLCADGRTIRKDAFKDNDGETVPLVWNHQHNDPSNILGHALLENRDDGVYAYCKFNETAEGNRAKQMVQHGDIRSLSIWANRLKQSGGDVIHGTIRELSLVLAGANPGAYIDYVMAHSDDGEDAIEVSYDENIMLYHSLKEDEEKDPKIEDNSKGSNKSEEPTNEPKNDDNSKNLQSKEANKENMDNKSTNTNGNKTIGDVMATLSPEQQDAVAALIGSILEDNGITLDDVEGENKEMKHNIFEGEMEENVLSHDAMKAIIDDGKRLGSLRESFLAHAEDYGIENIDWLFPDAKYINEGAPEFIKRKPDAWVDVVMNGVHHTPFSRIKMLFADLREDDARARGYMKKGKLKKEEVFGLLKRKVDPTTVYKKQKLDKDDIIDITDFDVVSWVKGEMRLMLDEEIARAILFGDGRSSLSEDKIDETRIIPVCSEAPLYKLEVTPASASAADLIDACVIGQNDYEGSGNTTMFTANDTVTDMLLIKDVNGHRIYKTIEEVAMACSVNKIVKVPASIIPSGIKAVILDLDDYNVGADKGGSVNMFEDFDIDYNQEKYLIETRCSGALRKPFSAVVVKEYA